MDVFNETRARSGGYRHRGTRGLRTDPSSFSSHTASHPDTTLMFGVREALSSGTGHIASTNGVAFHAPSISQIEKTPPLPVDTMRNLDKMLLCYSHPQGKVNMRTPAPSKRATLHNQASFSVPKPAQALRPSPRIVSLAQSSDLEFLEHTLLMPDHSSLKYDSPSDFSAVFEGFTPETAAVEEPDRFLTEILGKGAVPPTDLGPPEHGCSIDDKMRILDVEGLMQTAKFTESDSIVDPHFDMHRNASSSLIERNAAFPVSRATSSCPERPPKAQSTWPGSGSNNEISLSSTLSSVDQEFEKAFRAAQKGYHENEDSLNMTGGKGADDEGIFSRTTKKLANEGSGIRFEKPRLGTGHGSGLSQPSPAFSNADVLEKDSRDTSPSSGVTSVAGISSAGVQHFDESLLQSLQQTFKFHSEDADESNAIAGPANGTVNARTPEAAELGSMPTSLVTKKSPDLVLGEPYGPDSIQDRFDELPEDVQGHITHLRAKVSQMPRRKLRNFLAREVTLKEIEPLMIVNRDDLAKMLSLGVTTWKSFVHKELGVSRWPARGLKSVENKAREALERLETAEKEGRAEEIAALQVDLSKLQSERNAMMAQLRAAARGQRLQRHGSRSRRSKVPVGKLG